MKRPQFWLRRIAFLVIILTSVQYLLSAWFFPRAVIKAISRLTSGEVSVERARISPRLTALLAGICAKHNSDKAALRIQELAFHPRQFWFVPWLLEMDSVDVERPYIRITRTPAGFFIHPQLKEAADLQQPSGSLGAESLPHRALRWIAARWRLHVDALRITNGTVEFIDEWPATPFHVAFEHAEVSVGPFSFPDRGEPVSFAIHGLVTGFEGKSAPAYCSGWIVQRQGDMEIACQLEPLALAIFDPYFQETPVIRVYNSTVALTSQWAAKAHAMQARLHIELDHLDEGDISLRGHTILNIKKLAKEGERRVLAEIAVSGNLERADSWKGNFIPGNEPAQRLVEHLLEREITMLRVPFGLSRIGLQLTPAGGIEMQDMQAASKEISEALEMLAAPVVSSVPVDGAPPYAAQTVPVIFSPSMILGLTPVENPQEPAAAPEAPSQ